MSLLAAVMGTLLVLQLHYNFLKKIIPIPLVLVLFYLIKNPSLGLQKRKVSHKPGIVYSTAAAVFGLYDGFLGPGTGTFLAMSFVHFLGLDIRSATIRAKLFNFLSNFASMTVFIVAGRVYYKLGLCMAVGQLIGAKIASHIILKQDLKILRWLFISVSAVLLLLLLYESILDGIH